MRTFDCPRCPLCSSQGVRRYQGLRDRLFTAPGEWNLNQCPNKACGIFWLDPMPVEEDLGEAYRDYLTHGVLAGHHISPKQRAYLRTAYDYFEAPEAPVSRKERLLAAQFRARFRRRANFDGEVFYLPMPSGRPRFLDVGCGNGQNISRLAMLGWDVEGVEFDPAAVAFARGQGLKVHLGSLAEQNLPAASFDAVGLNHVIEHVPKPVEVMAECRRILKPGGTIAIITPNIHSLGHFWYGSNWVALDPPRHLHIFSIAALRQAARAAGFGRIEITTTIRGADFIASTSASIRRTKRAAIDDYGWARKRAARFLQGLELFTLTFNDRLGEEIVMLAQNDADDGSVHRQLSSRDSVRPPGG